MTDLCQGGTLVQYDGKLRLLEIAQVPKERVSFLDKSVVHSCVTRYDRKCFACTWKLMGGVTACLENLKMSGIMTAVRKILGV